MNDTLSTDPSARLEGYVRRSGDNMTGPLGIGMEAPGADFTLRGLLATPITGTVTAAAGNPTLMGSNTDFLTELRVGDALRIGTGVYAVVSIDGATSLVLDPAPAASFTDSAAYRDRDLLRVESGAGETDFVMNKNGNIGVRTANPTSSLSFGLSHSQHGPDCSDRPNGFNGDMTLGATNRCRNDVISVYENEAAKNKFGLGIHGATLELFSGPGGKIQLGARDDGSTDASKTGFFTPVLSVEPDLVRVGRLRSDVVGVADSDVNYGTKLRFSGGSVWPSSTHDSDNTDPLWIARYNAAFNSSELRINVGDDVQAGDKLAVGYTNGSGWHAVFEARADGTGLLPSVTSTRASKRDVGRFEESALPILQKVELVTYNYKADPQDRVRRVGFIADDPAHPYDPRLTDNGKAFDVQTATALFIGAVQEQQKLIEQQRAQISTLKNLVCRDRSKDPSCR